MLGGWVDAVAGDDGGTDARLRVEPATVTAVAASSAEDGRALLTVTWRTVPVQVAYLGPWVPTAADVTAGTTVLLLLRGTSAVVLGPIHGTPPDVPDA